MKSEKEESTEFEDKGGRRLENDRRHYSYTCHLPERREGKNRRCGKDRRNEIPAKPKSDA